MLMVTAIAPVNIAVIKYWGKKDAQKNIPINDSISGTLSTDVMYAKTTVYTSSTLEKNRFWLNGEEQVFEGTRIHSCVCEVRSKSDETLPHLTWNLAICSENNFPTAAGLASSAAGYACLVYALGALFKLKDELSSIARVGSGSACRSMYGGWVLWQKGTSSMSNDSVARPIASHEHWPEMRVLILVVNDNRKKHPSTIAMQNSVTSSSLIHYRAKDVVPHRIKEMHLAILTKDFRKFAEITMKDSNQFHAICLDTYPPCFYLNTVSQAIIDLVHAYNDYKGEHVVAYTFDAGPNACLYMLEPVLEEFTSIINYVFPQPADIHDNDYFRGLTLPRKPVDEMIVYDMDLQPYNAGKLKYIIYTKLGEGPKLLSDPKEHLLSEDGLPL
ncbi:hypothetical protein GWI33_021237 [Rhynchophorus ferrugineus]|uniref:Diphosphomevalonate decarboxylase n=1 Tax=Rhynchophorus ferrugineus TaxID=354439 RepID=A0A834LZT3_RHYFE|nr:hypothetical protein GWI33_021237 [Rhynchophorus ferrugineus]